MIFIRISSLLLFCSDFVITSSSNIAEKIIITEFEEIVNGSIVPWEVHVNETAKLAVKAVANLTESIKELNAKFLRTAEKTDLICASCQINIIAKAADSFSKQFAHKFIEKSFKRMENFSVNMFQYLVKQMKNESSSFNENSLAYWKTNKEFISNATKLHFNASSEAVLNCFEHLSESSSNLKEFAKNATEKLDDNFAECQEKENATECNSDFVSLFYHI